MVDVEDVLPVAEDPTSAFSTHRKARLVCQGLVQLRCQPGQLLVGEGVVTWLTVEIKKVRPAHDGQRPALGYHRVVARQKRPGHQRHCTWPLGGGALAVRGPRPRFRFAETGAPCHRYLVEHAVGACKERVLW